MRCDIDLGLTGDRPALLDLTELLATRLLVQGNSGSGKSHLLRRLLEQSAGLVQQAIIDPEGNFSIIDFNDWPSFSPFRADATKAIAKFILAKIKKKFSTK